MSKLHVVVLAGGSGTRFWPAGRRDRPKQLLPLAAGRSLLRATIERVAPACGIDAIWIATSAALAEAVHADVPEIARNRLILEPEARDTAPCAALAAARIDAVDPGAIIAMLPADHLIEPHDRFREILLRGADIARDGRTLVIFGIRPTHAATGYGYVEPGEPIDRSTPTARRVVRFLEKPDRDTATTFLAGGRMLWNSGMFVWTSASLQAAMRASAPELAAAHAAMVTAARANDVAALETAFRSAPRTSIDFAVMERAPGIAVVEADLDWNDVGSFAALPALDTPDPNGNARILQGGARAVTEDAHDCVIYGEGPGTVVLLGVRDLVVARVGDVVMVCPKDRAEEVKRLQETLRVTGCEDLL